MLALYSFLKVVANSTHCAVQNQPVEQNMRRSWRWAGSTVLAAAGLCAGCAWAQAGFDDSASARLLMAARGNDLPALERALADGGSINARNRLGETALVSALKRNQLDMARRLIDAGADVNLAAINGITPLMAAAYAGDADIVARLLAHDASVDAVDRIDKTALIYAAGEGRADIVRLLLAKGVDVNHRYANDLTLLMWAAGYGKDDVVKLLIAAGADPELKDNRGKTAADIARDGRYVTTGALLAKKSP